MLGPGELQMPKPGFRSVTFPESILDRFEEIYKNSKSDLQSEGIFSFTGFLTSRLSKQFELERK